MRTHRYYAPLDPDCPRARAIREWARDGFDDPMTRAYGAGDVIAEMLADKETRHRAECARCQAYGAANIDVVDF